MPKSYEEIIREIVDRAAVSDEDFDVQTLMQDPKMMQETMQGGEMMWMNPDMMTNPQRYDTMNPPPPRGMLDPLRQGEKYEDSATMDQYARDEKELGRGIRQYPTTPSINPTKPRPDPDRDDLDGVFPGYSRTDPTVPNMQKLYRQMPMPKPQQPNTPMQTPDQYMMHNVPKQYEQPELDSMQQLQQFFMGGSEI